MARIRRWCQQRVPEHARSEVAVECDVTPRHLTIVECRPPWRQDAGEQWTRFPIARLRYAKATRQWPCTGVIVTSASTSTTGLPPHLESMTCSRRSTATLPASSGDRAEAQAWPAGPVTRRSRAEE